MKRAVLLPLAVALGLLPIGTAGAARKPTTAELASIVAGHQAEITRLVELEQTCSSFECYTADARLDRAEALARESLALHEELVETAGTNAKRAPVRVRRLTRTTVGHANDVVEGYDRWVTCVNANSGKMAPCDDDSLAFSELRAAWPATLDRWDPYL